MLMMSLHRTVSMCRFQNIGRSDVFLSLFLSLILSLFLSLFLSFLPSLSLSLCRQGMTLYALHCQTRTLQAAIVRYIRRNEGRGGGGEVRGTSFSAALPSDKSLACRPAGPRQPFACN